MSVPTVPGWYWWTPTNDWAANFALYVGYWQEEAIDPRLHVWERQPRGLGDGLTVTPIEEWGGTWGPRIPPPGEKPVYGVSWSSMDFQCLGCGAASDMVEVCAHEDGCAHGGSGYRTLPSPARLAALEELAKYYPIDTGDGFAGPERCRYCDAPGDYRTRASEWQHKPTCPWLRAQPAPEDK